VKDEFDLQRFVDAQERVYGHVTAELSAGRKRSHWMWFVFPQLKGLGFSATSQRYGISGLDEARAYLDHPILGPRLRECTGLMLQIEGRSLDEILGYPDNLKFRSSMTLFSRAGDDHRFDAAIGKYCAGEPDARTLALLRD
jgi:uncharacterized protein (DUF1810 family)